jgi:hypothetical protein
MTAVLLQDPSTTGALTAQILTNTIYFDQPNATNGTALWIIDGQSGVSSTGSSLMTIQSNVVQFQSTGGTGMRFGLYNRTSDLINMNSITDLAGGATGMLFDGVGSGSAIQFTQNLISLMANDPTTHRGIIFSQVSPTLTLLAPSGSTSNTIYNTTTLANGFSIPTGTAVGGIIIDGTYIAAP